MHQSATGACESFLAAELTEVTGCGTPPPDVSLAELGCTSRDAIFLASAVEVEYGLALDVADVLDAGSIRDLCALIDARRGGA